MLARFTHPFFISPILLSLALIQDTQGTGTFRTGWAVPWHGAFFGDRADGLARGLKAVTAGYERQEGEAKERVEEFTHGLESN